MKGWRTATVLVSILFVASNGWWLYSAIDTAVTQTFRDQMLFERTKTTNTLAAMLPSLAEGKSRDDIVATAEKAVGEKAFEKDGATWVGLVGLVFDDKGALTQVRPSWLSEEQDRAR